jgi:hypothetical protein
MTKDGADRGTLHDAIADARLAANHGRFVELLVTAEARAAAGDLGGAALLAGQTANWAWINHPGIHASPRLEELVRSIAPRVGVSRWDPAGRAGRRGHVLHVLTEAYPTGGHTRLAERIIKADPERTHSCVVVRQHPQRSVPVWLEQAVERSGGTLTVLRAGGLVDRALTLRRMAGHASLVIANVHPDDITSCLAFADPRARPPVAALNHADHSYWLGAGFWDLLVNIRQAGEELSIRRRGVRRSRSTILALPLEERRRTLSQAHARRALGVSPDEVMLLTVGSPWKFDPEETQGEPSFLDVLVPIVERDPRIRLFALGPFNHGRWADAGRRTGGRVLALGTRTDAGVYQQATDVYLDPFPMGSLYGLLEAGSLGIPILSYREWPAEAAALFCDSPGLGAGHLVATTPAEYEAALQPLLADPAARETLGRRAAEEIAAAHSGPAWQATLFGVLDAAPAARAAHLDEPPGLPAEADTPTFSALDRGLATVLQMIPLPPERMVSHLPLARG